MQISILLYQARFALHASIAHRVVQGRWQFHCSCCCCCCCCCFCYKFWNLVRKTSEHTVEWFERLNTLGWSIYFTQATNWSHIFKPKPNYHTLELWIALRESHTNSYTETNKKPKPSKFIWNCTFCYVVHGCAYTHITRQFNPNWRGKKHDTNTMLISRNTLICLFVCVFNDFSPKPIKMMMTVNSDINFGEKSTELLQLFGSKRQHI